MVWLRGFGPRVLGLKFRVCSCLDATASNLRPRRLTKKIRDLNAEISTSAGASAEEAHWVYYEGLHDSTPKIVSVII